MMVEIPDTHWEVSSRSLAIITNGDVDPQTMGVFATSHQATGTTGRLTF